MEYFIPFLVVGVIVTACLFALVLWLRQRNIMVTWYEWLIGIVGLVLLLIAVQHVFGALAEFFPYAAWMGLLVLGLPALILLAIFFALVVRKQRA